VPELRRVHPGVVVCLAPPEALDALIAPGYGARQLRTAPDEAMFVTDPATTAEVLRETTDRIAALAPDALVAEVTDGWAAWELAGAGARDAFASISPLAPPEPGDWLQGEVARVGAKVLGARDGLLVMVPASLDHHLHERLRRDCSATEVTT
jgi:glycine cleavage system aminomethyltransferase T